MVDVGRLKRPSFCCPRKRRGKRNFRGHSQTRPSSARLPIKHAARDGPPLLSMDHQLDLLPRMSYTSFPFKYRRKSVPSSDDLYEQCPEWRANPSSTPSSPASASSLVTPAPSSSPPIWPTVAHSSPRNSILGSRRGSEQIFCGIPGLEKRRPFPLSFFSGNQSTHYRSANPLPLSPGFSDEEPPLRTQDTLELFKDVEELRSERLTSHEPPSPSVFCDDESEEEDADDEMVVEDPLYSSASSISMKYEVSSERGRWRDSDQLPYLAALQQERIARLKTPAPVPCEAPMAQPSSRSTLPTAASAESMNAPNTVDIAKLPPSPSPRPSSLPTPTSLLSPEPTEEDRSEQSDSVERTLLEAPPAVSNLIEVRKTRIDLPRRS